MIRCEWKEDGKFLIEADGQVYPCCYLNTPDFRIQHKDLQENTESPMDKYNEYREELNIFNNDIEDIFNHEWWNILRESWTKKPHHRCTMFCTREE